MVVRLIHDCVMFDVGNTQLLILKAIAIRKGII